MSSKVSLETLVSLAKRRGFVWQASEIYGGVAGFYNYGPYGTQMLRNLQARWWADFVQSRANIVGLDSAIIQHPKLWQASGHTKEFADPMVECTKCGAHFREDEVGQKACSSCGAKGSFKPVNPFNLMFQTNVGAVADDAAKAYLRPETAGGIFTDFELVRLATRQKLPFGIAQLGKAFRNEISPREFLFRLREFNQAELEYFVHPEQADKEFDNLLKMCQDWLLAIGIDKTKLSSYEHSKKERSHYSTKTIDMMYEYPFGKKELWGVANRTDFDLRAQAKGSGKAIEYFDQESNEKFVPYIIEPSLGLDRLFLALLDSAYSEEEVKGETRVLLKLHPDIAPVQVAVLPLSKDKKLSPLASQVYEDIKGKYLCEYDETQSIGKRYRRQDEIGTPYCVTVDFDSLEDKAVTVRSRDTMKQERVGINKLVGYLSEKL